MQHAGEPGDTFSAGVFSRATVGLRKSCKLFPLSVQAVNRFACAVAPEATWTSLAILDRPTGGEHVDARNADALTVVIPLSQFTHGELQVKTPEGAVTLQVSQGPAVFNAKLHPHSVEPATGRRVVLVLFTLDCTGLPTQDFACLQRLGFRLPQPAQVLKEKPDRPQLLSLSPHQQALLPCKVQCAGQGRNSLPPQGPCQLDRMPSQLQDLAKPSQVPLLVEICAGSAILSATALACGWDALPVDKASCRFESHTPLILLDMRDPQTVEVLTRLDKQRPVSYWHFGLPCGTASRARERPMGLAPCGMPTTSLAFHGSAALRQRKHRQQMKSTVQPLSFFFLPSPPVPL